jgi:hypothetical protein
MKTLMIAYGISLVTVPWLMLGLAYLLNLLKIPFIIDSQDLFIDFVFALMVMILLNLGILMSDVIVNVLLNFQQKNNAENIGRSPIRFALENRSGIKFIYKVVFCLLSIMMFYAIWLAKKQ